MKSIVKWAVSSSPAVNTLTVGVLIVGLVSLISMKREVFPQFELEIVLVSVPYPGASPEEVEEGICQKIEEAVRGIEGIKRLASIAQEGAGYVILELETWVDVQKTLDRVQAEVDRIPSFPELAEDPEVEQIVFREPVIRVGVIGPGLPGMEGELQLRNLTERVRADILQLPTVTQVELTGSRPFQIDVEISEDRLREYGLTLSRVAEILRRENLELPGGLIKTTQQEVLLRGKDKRLTGAEIAEIPLVTNPDGVVLRVRDLGTVHDGFEDVTAINRVNGRDAMVISVDRTRSEDLLAIVNEVKEYVRTAKLPPGYMLRTWGDRSIEVRDRMDLLIRNGLSGLVLVFFTLALFLEMKLAFWVAMGIPISILGASVYLLYAGQTLNMLSMFAFLMALGIVVDDAIVVGENVFERRQKGVSPEKAAVEGTMEVLPSVSAAVTTTIIAFMPLLFVSGVMGKFIAIMPIAVIAMLVISLFESTFMLPCHLAHARMELSAERVSWGVRSWRAVRHWPAPVRLTLGGLWVTVAELAWRLSYPFLVLPHAFHWLSQHLSHGLETFVHRYYTPFLQRCLNHPGLVLSCAVSIVIASLSLVRAGVTPWVAFPKTDSNEVFANIAFPDGTPASVTDRAASALEQTILDLHAELKQKGMPILRTTRVSVGQVADPSQLGPDARASGSHVARVDVELVEAGQRTLSSQEIVSAWRNRAPRFPGAETINFGEAAIGPGGTPIEFRLLAEKDAMDQLEAAAEECKSQLATFAGIVDIRDDSQPGKWEFQIQVRERAESLGISLAQIAETVRAAYYGQEVMRLQRGRHEVKLMVRYPKDERAALHRFDEIRIRSADGAEYPIRELADVKVTRGYSEINRIDQLRAIAIMADVVPGVGNAQETVNALKAKFIPDLLQRYPEVSILWEGQQQQTMDSISSLLRGLLIALVAMFVLLTVEFRSYLQPLMILAILPFGMVGALWGHALMGLPLTLFSVFGLVALTGVVVNDSIVLVDAINKRHRAGIEGRAAIVDGCQRRFRPVLLTSVTTIAGLTPLLFEKSFQAQFLIPLAVTMVFGLTLTTLLVLILVPVLYSIYERWCLSPVTRPLAASPPTTRRPQGTDATGPNGEHLVDSSSAPSPTDTFADVELSH